MVGHKRLCPCFQRGGRNGAVDLRVSWTSRPALPYPTFRKAYLGACRGAKVTGRSIHDLRRSTARELRRAGVSEAVCQSVTGHLTSQIFRRYAIVDSHDQAEALKGPRGTPRLRTGQLQDNSASPRHFREGLRMCKRLVTWRRRRDSNPRYRFRHNGFQDRRLQPLGHSSGRRG